MSVDLVGPDGKEYTLRSDDPTLLDNAKKQGFRVASEIGVVDSALDTAKAAGAGLVQGASFNLFGAGAGSAQGDEEPPESAQARWKTAAELSRLKEEHPYADTAGELAGAVLSPVNKVGGAVTGSLGATTRLGRIGAAGAGQAVVGSLYGAGTALNDAALGEADLTADKLIAYMGLGGLLGFGGGAASEALIQGGAALLPKLSKSVSGAQSTLDDIANDAAVKSTRATQAQLNRIGETRLGEIGATLRERGHLKLSPDAMAESISADREGVGQLLGKFLDDAEAKGATPAHSEMLARLDSFEQGLNPLERKAIASDLTAAREAIAELGSRPAGATGKAGSGFRALDDLKQTIQAKAKFARGPTPLDDVTAGLKRQLAGVFRDELDKQLLPQLGAAGAKAFTESKALYGLLKDAEKLATSGAQRSGGVQMKDLLWGVAGGSLHPAGIASTIGAKFLREHGQALIAKTADAIAKSPSLSAIAQSMATTLPQLAPKLGPYAATLTTVSAEGAPKLLATHLALAQVDPGYESTATLAGLQPEHPEAHVAALRRGHEMANVASAAKSTDEEIAKHMQRIFKGSGEPHASGDVLKSQDFGEKRMRRDAPDAHDKRVSEVRELATNPEALIDRVAQNSVHLGAIAPTVSSAMAARAQAAVQYLAKSSLVPPKPGPLAREWVTTEAERHEFAQRLEVVQEPLAVMRHAAAGTLTPIQVQALREVYPRLADAVAEQALARIAENPKSVPYGARMMLTMLSGVDVDGTMSQQAIASNQLAIRGKSQEQSQDAAQKPVARSEMKSAARLALPQQRRELESE